MWIHRNVMVELRDMHRPEARMSFARDHHITQIFLARPQQSGRMVFGRSLAQQVVRLAEEMQVIVIGNRKRPD